MISIKHPDYLHVSPAGPGLYTETPVWVVSEPAPSNAAASRTRLPANINSTELRISGDLLAQINPKESIRAPLVRGSITLPEGATSYPLRGS